MSSTISKVDLERVVGAFPDWLADEISDWVQRAEGGGTRFVSALDAVRQALEWHGTGQTPLPSDVPLDPRIVRSAVQRGPRVDVNE